MSYCRFSCENGYSDVYVYEDVCGGWTIHVAARRWPLGRPEGVLEAIDSHANNPKGEFDFTAAAEARDRQKAWDAENPPYPIKSPLAGASYREPTPQAAADKLEELRAEGFQVPQYAIDQLREEANDMGFFA